MKTYRILVHDLRCPEPIVLTAEMGHDERACEFASQRLASSHHYAAVEVWRGVDKLFHLASAPEPFRAAA